VLYHPHRQSSSAKFAGQQNHRGEYVTFLDRLFLPFGSHTKFLDRRPHSCHDGRGGLALRDYRAELGAAASPDKTIRPSLNEEKSGHQ